MSRFLSPLLRDFRNDLRGVTALEYGLLAGIVAVTLIGILTTFEGDLQRLFNNVDTNISVLGSNTTLTSGG